MSNLLASLNRACTRKRGAVSFAGVLCFMFLVGTNLSFAQESIPLVNHSFEQPGARETNWDNIPGWSLDAPAIDSGVATNSLATDGTFVAWLDSDDNVLWQLTEYTIQEGDLITLKADVRNSWQTTTFDLMLYYDDSGTRVPVATTTGDFEGFVDPFLTEFTVKFLAAGVPASVGHLLGVAVRNTSVPNSFVEMDNFRLSKATATLEAVALVNPSFEQPGARETNWDNIPGWSLDAPAIDSGVATNSLATDGTFVAWLDSDDGVLWQLTGYTIQAGDVLTLKADVRNSWQTTTFDLMLYYDDNGTRVTVATTTGDFEGFVDPFLTEFSVTFAAVSVPASVGHLLGVAVRNTSVPNSFVEMDNFRLSQAVTTSVERTEDLPISFGLEQNYPNPFNPGTNISFQLPKGSEVTLTIYNVLGQPVRTLVQEQRPAGVHVIAWDGRNDNGEQMASGVYHYRLQAESFAETKKMLLIK